MNKQVKRVIVVGGGFAGFNFLKSVANDSRFEVTLIDKNNYHYFPPLLYQVGMAFIELSNITYPFRRYFQKRTNLRFHLGTVTAIDPKINAVYTESNVLYYDYLIIAFGTETNYFGLESVQKNSLALKTINDALKLRNHLLCNVEKAIHCKDENEKKRLLNVVIAGGGPTGVEVAGMLAEMIKKIGRKEYPELPTGSFRIYLIQSGPVLLNNMSKVAQEESLQVLQGLGVQVLLNTRVTGFDEGRVLLNNGDAIPTHALLWTTGVIGRELTGLPPGSFGHGRRILVDEYCRVKGTENIFAIGDISLNLSDSRYPAGHPQLAQVAIQQGKLLAENLKRGDLRQWKTFQYKDKGTMAIISKYNAVADLPRLSLKGFSAWFLWLFIHLLPIAGFRNKFDLLSNWAWSFLTNNPTLRVIIQKDNRKESMAQKMTATK
ncbi:MAG TPA: NAD(P)/FAD-dependent oxidoreductase [Chryseosolibacter sp.]